MLKDLIVQRIYAENMTSTNNANSTPYKHQDAVILTLSIKGMHKFQITKNKTVQKHSVYIPCILHPIPFALSVYDF